MGFRTDRIMWCAHCQADVAAEVSADTRHIHCASCGAEITSTLARKSETKTQQARELLERWARERGLNPLEGFLTSADSPRTPSSEQAAVSSEHATSADESRKALPSSAVTTTAASPSDGPPASFPASVPKNDSAVLNMPESRSRVVQREGSGSDTGILSANGTETHRAVAASPSPASLTSSGTMAEEKLHRTAETTTAFHEETPPGKSSPPRDVVRREDGPHHPLPNEETAPSPASKLSGADNRSHFTKSRYGKEAEEVSQHFPNPPHTGEHVASSLTTSLRKSTNAVSEANPPATPAKDPEKEKWKPLTGKPRNWVAAAGQWLAYLGVLGLMGGACLVILGYFRGPASYAPTGWLITMAGQMLLFLGVVTLISNGMEETVQAVSQQISRLDAKLWRIEQATQTLQAPHALQQFREKENVKEHHAVPASVSPPSAASSESVPA